MSRTRCPICSAPAEPAHRPFCSRGCRERDLLRWLDEGYRLPGPMTDPDHRANEGLDTEGERP